MNNLHSRHRGSLAAWLCILLIVLLPLCRADAAAAETRIIRVPLAELEGLSMLDGEGNWSGVIVDFLDEISNYTNWEYEITLENDGQAMLSDFIAGKYDLVCGNYYAPSLEEHYAYPDYSIGNSQASLFALKDNDSVHSFDLRSFNGKTIGVYERSATAIRYLKAFLDMNNVDYELKYYTYEEIKAAGNLYPYLRSGEVDMLLGYDPGDAGDIRRVVTFDSQPYYICASPGDPELLEELNFALKKIYDADPDFAHNSYSLHFEYLTKVEDVIINGAEQAYIADKKVATVAVQRDNYPLFYSAAEGAKGIVPEIFACISSTTGLQFEFLECEDSQSVLDAVQEGRADLAGCLIHNLKPFQREYLALTSPYASLDLILMRNQNSLYPAGNLTAALPEGARLPAGVEAERVVYYETTAEALQAVEDGNADFTVGISAALDRMIQENGWNRLVPSAIGMGKCDLAIGMRWPVNSDFFSLMEKGVHLLNPDDTNMILKQNINTIKSHNITLKQFVYSNPVQSICVVAGILLILMLAVVIIMRLRFRTDIALADLEKAEAMSKAKSSFLSNMSHELRTPMNAVIGLTELTCMLDEVPPAVRCNLEKIRSSSHYLLSLINGILDMSRIDSNTIVISREPFSLREMIDGIQNMLEEDAAARGLHFAVNVNGTHELLEGDMVRLRQVLTNLLSNAFKFTPSGGHVTLAVTETDFDERGATYAFSVTDDGIGISPEDQERIFEVFEQAGSTTLQSKGTGLGLPISRALVDQMGGTLALESRLDQGSKFSFTLCFPRSAPQREEELPEGANLLMGVRILLAEDNDLNAEIAQAQLKMQGAEVCRVENGKLALERFARSEKGEFLLILMDIQMPVMNGLEATRAIRALKREDAAAIPIIAMTASSFQEDVDAAKQAGMTDFLAKPMETKILYQAILKGIKQKLPEDRTEMGGGGERP